MRNIDKYLSLLNDEVDGLLLTSRYSRHYGAEFDIAEGVAIVTKAGCRYFTDSRYIESAQNGIRGFEVICVDKIGYVKLINDAIADFGITTLGFEENYLTVAEFNGYTADLNARLVPMNAKIYGFRAVKEEWELELMRKAQAITDKAFAEVCPRIKVGMTEQQVAGLALGKMHELGAERESYPVWVLTGKGSNQAISRPRNKAIEKGDLTHIQIGARVAGYASTIGRAVVFGKATPEQKELIEVTYKAQEAVANMLMPGVPAAEVAQAHIDNVTRMGYGDWLLYGPCHGNGQMEGEAPWIETSADFVLEENMTFCLCIFLGSDEKEIGLRMEDVVCVKEGGVERLTNYPRELFEIPC